MLVVSVFFAVMMTIVEMIIIIRQVEKIVIILRKAKVMTITIISRYQFHFILILKLISSLRSQGILRHKEQSYTKAQAGNGEFT